jgi:hypothetical protein
MTSLPHCFRECPAQQPKININMDPYINPAISDLLRDFTPDWISHVVMRSPAWKLDEIVVCATSDLLYNFDFPHYYDYESGVYRAELQVSIVNHPPCRVLTLLSELFGAGSMSVFLRFA